MTEAELERLLRRTDRRLRLLRAAAAACGIFIGAMLLAAAVVTVRRLTPGQTADELWRWWPLLATAVPAAALFGFFWRGGSPERAAAVLDRRADLAARLITWCAYRRRPMPTGTYGPALVTMQQRDAAAAAEKTNFKSLLPWRLPGWSGAAWFALLLLGCAWLLPERTADGTPSDDETGGNTARVATTLPGRPAAWSVNDVNDGYAVQLLSPTAKLKYQLAAMNRNLPTELKEKLLRELERKIGAVPEEDLAKEIRDLLHDLRRQVKEAGAPATGEPPDGKSSLRDDNGSAAGVERDPVAALAAAARDFPDCAAALKRYHKWLFRRERSGKKARADS